MTTLLIIACMIGWGLGVFFMKIAGAQLSPYTCMIFSIPGYVIIAAAGAGRADYHWTGRHAAAVAVGALYMLANMAYYKLCQTADVSRVAPITSAYVVLPVLLGWVVLGEPVTWRRVLGVVFAGVALYLLASDPGRQSG